ncbi:MAG: preprotein translocase subunit SecY [bacterium]
MNKIGNIFEMPELRKRLFFTLGLLAIYRVGVFIPVPGVNRTAMSQVVGGSGGGILGLVNLFTGGALSLMSIFALGIMPYISASIIFQLMTVVVPAIERLQKEGEAGRKKINQWTRYATVGLSIIQGTGISFYLENMHSTNPEMGLLIESGWPFRIMTVITLVTGTLFVMWLGEQITEGGIGNGISLIITAGIIAGFPQATINTLQLVQSGSITTFSLLILILVVLAVTAVIVFMESAQRRIPLQYARRMVGRRIYGGQTHDLPLKVNMAGVIPPIFASSLLIFPTTLASYFEENPIAIAINAALVPGDWRYNVVYIILIVFFCFFYTAVQVNPVDMADNLKKSDAFIPGIRPGRKTAEYLDEVMSRLTFAGAIYISVICVLPYFLQDSLGITFYFGGTSLLIVVSVGLDTVSQIENHLITRQYDDFSAKAGVASTSARIKGREET